MLPNQLPDQFPEGYQTYLCHYTYEGHTWSVDILATSFEDANRRLEVLSQCGEIVGELKSRTPISIKRGWFERLRNLFNDGYPGLELEVFQTAPRIAYFETSVTFDDDDESLRDFPAFDDDDESDRI